jgi:hypothetical protein
VRALTSERFGRWTRGTGIVALVAVAWVVVTDGLFWSAVVAAGLLGSTVAISALLRRRQIPSLARVITIGEAAEPLAVPAGCGYTSRAGIRQSPRGDRKP